MCVLDGRVVVGSWGNEKEDLTTLVWSSQLRSASSPVEMGTVPKELVIVPRHLARFLSDLESFLLPTNMT